MSLASAATLALETSAPGAERWTWHPGLGTHVCTPRAWPAVAAPAPRGRDGASWWARVEGLAFWVLVAGGLVGLLCYGLALAPAVRP